MRPEHYLGVVAIALAWIAMVLGTAAFTPAILLCWITIPMSVVVGFMGAWRLSILGLWFAVAAWLASPAAGIEILGVEWFVLGFTVAGVFIGAGLAVNYRRSDSG